MPKNDTRTDFFEMTNSCTCTDEEGNYPGFCYGCFDDDVEYLNEFLKDLDDFWSVHAEDVTWRNFTADMSFEAEDAKDWIRKVVGFECDWTFRISTVARDKDGRAMTIFAKVFHHDSPTGESRIIKRAEQCEFCEKVANKTCSICDVKICPSCHQGDGPQGPMCWDCWDDHYGG